MAKKKKETSIMNMIKVKIINRQVQKDAGLDIPDKYGLNDILEIIEIAETPQYVLWNKGKPVANETGGIDCIAYLYLKDGEIRGWSI